MSRFSSVRRRTWPWALLATGIALILAAAAASAPAYGATGPAFAPLDQPGPPLGVSLAQLQASLHCESTVANASVEPVLLNPATGSTPAQNYSWNWEIALDKLGIPWCAYTAPHSTMDDIQTSGEYLTYAVRTMYAMAGRKIAIMGQSQGGMSMRWALRFWPDTRAMVDDVIGLSGSNHGSTALGPLNCLLGCAPAIWQQLAGSNFIRALNSGAETFPGISYTEIWTHTDETVDPAGSAATASAALHTGGGITTNVATQDICPHDIYEHLAIGTVDPVAYALAVDALTHPGPADPARIPKSVCAQTAMPGVSLLNLNTVLQIVSGLPTQASVPVGALAKTTSGAAELTSEPALACYVTGNCTGTAAPTLTVRALSAPLRPRHGQTLRLRVQVQAREGTALVPVPGARITFAPATGHSASIAGHAVSSSASGIATLVVRPSQAAKYQLTATLARGNPAAQTLRVY
jgi:hypothetical protein